jgi:hypothetical protein
MPGFQPVYSGNTLTQAAGNAARSIAGAAEARAQGYQNFMGNFISTAQLTAAAVNKMQDDREKEDADKPTPEQVKAAQDAGALPKDAKPEKVTGRQYKASLENQRSLLQMQTAAIQLKSAETTTSIAVSGRSTLLGPVAGSSPSFGNYGNYGGGK